MGKSKFEQKMKKELQNIVKKKKEAR